MKDQNLPSNEHQAVETNPEALCKPRILLRERQRHRARKAEAKHGDGPQKWGAMNPNAKWLLWTWAVILGLWWCAFSILVHPGSIVWLPFMPIGLWFMLWEYVDSFPEWIPEDLLIPSGWLLYLFVTVVAYRARRPYPFYLWWSILVALLCTNVTGCTMVIARIANF